MISETEEPISCVKVSQEEAARSCKETTEAELSKLAKLIQTRKIPPRRDISSDEESEMIDSESDYEEHIPTSKIQKRNKSQNVESKMYIDNQQLWKKIHKYGIELNKVEKELHYMQLELNNKTIFCNELQEKCKTIIFLENKNYELFKKINYLRICILIYFFLLFCIVIDYSVDHTFFTKTFHLILFLVKQMLKASVILHNKLLD
jgi:hypothetical protein